MRRGYSIGSTRPQCQQKRVIVIAAEGMVTEPKYFLQLNSMSQTTVIAMVPNWGNGSDPQSVLGRMKEYLRENPLGSNDEAWIVLDRDDWPEDKITAITAWEKRDGRYHFALSHRRFEDWLKLHIVGDQEAGRKFQRNISGKDKHSPDGFVTKARIFAAVERAKQLRGGAQAVGNVFELIEAFFRE